MLRELTAYGAGPDWFSLGDRDFGTHIARTSMLAAGLPLSAATRTLCERWRPGVTLLPMSDDKIETHVVIDDDHRTRTVHFQEWWVRMHAKVPARQIIAAGAEAARPAPGVLEAITAADYVVLPPSNPVVSVGIILSVPGIAAAVRAKTVVGISPIIGGAPVRGHGRRVPGVHRRARPPPPPSGPITDPGCSMAGWSTRGTLTPPVHPSSPGSRSALSRST